MGDVRSADASPRNEETGARTETPGEGVAAAATKRAGAAWNAEGGLAAGEPEDGTPEGVDANRATTADGQLRPLAVAAVLIRDGRLSSAEAVLRDELARRPEDVQASTMLELVASLRHRPRRSRVIGMTALGVTVLVLLALLVTGLVVKVRHDVTASCTARTKRAEVVRSVIGGVAAKVRVQRGDTVASGAHLGTVVDRRTRRRRDSLGAEIEDLQELLHIMETGGSYAVAREQKRILKSARRQRARFQDCKQGQACAKEVAAIEARMEMARKKLRNKIEALQRRFDVLAKQETHAELRAAKAGIVTRAPAEGADVVPQESLFELVRGDSFDAIVDEVQNIPEDLEARVVLLQRGARHVFDARYVKKLQDGKIALEVRAPIGLDDMKGECRAELIAGERSLFGELLERGLEMLR
jgi:hypothetical protein